MGESENIKNFLTHPDRKELLKIEAIERKAGIPTYSLSQYLKGQQKKRIPAKHIPNLVVVLRQIGYDPDKVYELRNDNTVPDTGESSTQK